MFTATATAAQRRSAARLAALASDAQIAYAPTGRVSKQGSRVWHEVRATSASGEEWTYYLAAESGSYAGSFLD